MEEFESFQSFETGENGFTLKQDAEASIIDFMKQHALLVEEKEQEAFANASKIILCR